MLKKIECTCWEKENKHFDPSQDYVTTLGTNAKGFFVDLCDANEHLNPPITITIKSTRQ
jgi:hypothetical protein